jgi:hypothetical protein
MFHNLHNVGGRTEDGAGLLTSILLRYSEIGAVHYRRDEHALQFTFMITEFKDEIAFKEIIMPALEFFHQLHGQDMRVLDISCRNVGDLTILTVIRDIDSISLSEIGLIIELLKGEFKSHLFCEEMSLAEEEEIFQEEMISSMLSTIQMEDIEKNVIALREEGRVLVIKN